MRVRVIIVSNMLQLIHLRAFQVSDQSAQSGQYLFTKLQIRFEAF